MIGLEDRQALARDIHTAHSAGARLKPVCEIAGIGLRTLQRWQAADGLVSGDRRPQAVRHRRQGPFFPRNTGRPVLWPESASNSYAVAPVTFW
jgi:hypothetical protein